MKYILYTTSKSSWYQKQADIFASEISKTKGRGEVSIDVEHLIPHKVNTLRDSDGDVRFSWDWFSLRFLQKGYDGVIFHFTPYYKRKWDIQDRINGSQNDRNTVYPEFWVCCDRNQMAKGYEDLTELLRLLFHEQAHFDENLDDSVGNILTHDSVHLIDYSIKQIHRYHHLVDYRGQAIRDKINRLMNEVIKFVKRTI